MAEAHQLKINSLGRGQSRTKRGNCRTTPSAAIAPMVAAQLVDT
jgi:hypothetical protein